MSALAAITKAVPARPPVPAVLPTLDDLLLDLRGLTLRQPWLWSITSLPVDQRKDVENRPVRPAASVVGRWIALHAGLVYDDNGRAAVERISGYAAPLGDVLPRGQIVALARLDGFAEVSALTGANRSRWAFGPWCYLLADLLVLPSPVDARGMQGSARG